jgi:hypothetical protein
VHQTVLSEYQTGGLSLQQILQHRPAYAERTGGLTTDCLCIRPCCLNAKLRRTGGLTTDCLCIRVCTIAGPAALRTVSQQVDPVLADAAQTDANCVLLCFCFCIRPCCLNVKLRCTGGLSLQQSVQHRPAYAERRFHKK